MPRKYMQLTSANKQIDTLSYEFKGKRGEISGRKATDPNLNLQAGG